LKISTTTPSKVIERFTGFPEILSGISKQVRGFKLSNLP